MHHDQDHQQDHPPPILLYEDDRFVAVHKPPGLLVHRSRLADDERFLLQMVRDLLGRRVYPVHRLDRATSGVILFGLDTEAAQRLHSSFEDQGVEKRYHSVVRGWIEQPGRVDHPLDDPESGKARRPAETLYRPLGKTEIAEPVGRYASARYSLVEAQPLTGRRHQIRRHLKHIGHPIVGDTTYGKGCHNRLFRDRFGSWRLCLRAVSLSFTHPFAGHRITIEAASEPGWDGLMEALNWTPVAPTD